MRRNRMLLVVCIVLLILAVLPAFFLLSQQQIPSTTPRPTRLLTTAPKIHTQTATVPTGTPMPIDMLTSAPTSTPAPSVKKISVAMLTTTSTLPPTVSATSTTIDGSSSTTQTITNPGDEIPLPFSPNLAAVYSLAFSPDGRILAYSGCVKSALFDGGDPGNYYGCVEGDIKLWDLTTHQLLKQHYGDFANILIFSSDSKTLVSGNPAGSVQVWDVVTGQPIKAPIVSYNKYGSGLALSPDGKWLAASSLTDIHLWDLTKRQQNIQTLSGQSGNVTSLAFSADSKLLAAGSEDGTIRLWNVITGQPVGTPLVGHTGAVTDVAFYPDATTLISGGDTTLRLWDVKSEKPMGVPLQIDSGQVRGFLISPDVRFAVVKGPTGTFLMMVDLSNGKQISLNRIGVDIVGGALAASFDLDGNTLALGGCGQKQSGPAGLVACEQGKVFLLNMKRI